MQAAPRGHLRAAESGISTDVRNPDRLPRVPDAANEPFPAFKGPVFAIFDEFSGLHVWRMPEVNEPENIVLLF